MFALADSWIRIENKKHYHLEEKRDEKKKQNNIKPHINIFKSIRIALFMPILKSFKPISIQILWARPTDHDSGHYVQHNSGYNQMEHPILIFISLYLKQCMLKVPDIVVQYRRILWYVCSYGLRYLCGDNLLHKKQQHIPFDVSPSVQSHSRIIYFFYYYIRH